MHFPPTSLNPCKRVPAVLVLLAIRVPQSSPKLLVAPGRHSCTTMQYQDSQKITICFMFFPFHSIPPGLFMFDTKWVGFRRSAPQKHNQVQIVVLCWTLRLATKSHKNAKKWHKDFEYPKRIQKKIGKTWGNPAIQTNRLLMTTDPYQVTCPRGASEKSLWAIWKPNWNMAARKYSTSPDPRGSRCSLPLPKLAHKHAKRHTSLLPWYWYHLIPTFPTSPQNLLKTSQNNSKIFKNSQNISKILKESRRYLDNFKRFQRCFTNVSLSRHKVGPN